MQTTMYLLYLLTLYARMKQRVCLWKVLLWTQMLISAIVPSVVAFVSDEQLQVNHPPTFLKSFYFVELSENNNIGDLVLQVTTRDVNWNDTLTYTLATGSADFTIDSNGQIRAKKAFDREATSSYEFAVEVSDGIDRPFTVQATVRVQISDVNDNKPNFRNTPYTYSVTLPENSNTSVEVLTVEATDADVGTNSFIQYRIVDGDADGSFKISLYGGTITLEKSLDYESKPNGYVLRVQATDLGAVPLSSIVSVNVHIADVDDQGPKFSQPLYSASVNEDLSIGFSVLTVSAFDQDKGSGQNHAVSYSIKSGNVGSAFELDPMTGELRVKNTLDREKKQGLYSLIVEASELGSNHPPASAKVDIVVLDVNDNPPVFPKHRYSVGLPENAQAGVVVTRVTAEDNDVDATNKLLKYEFNPPSDSKRPFLIDTERGDIILKSPVDYESGITSYTVQVTATNLLPPQASDTVTVVVKVVDINDNNPVFQSNVFAGNQDEGTAAHTFIVKALASDADSGTFGKLTYSIVAGNDGDRFEINSTTAAISNKKILDREEQDSYTLTVQAEDAGPHRRVAQATVNIVVNDINDNAPIFTDKSVTVNVDENNRINAQVASISATDADSGTNSALTYSISAGNTLNAFQITNPSKGIVTSRISLDYEKTKTYSLKIAVRDGGSNGGKADTATLIVNVVNQNDNAPVFTSSSYNFSVYENQINGVVGSVSATDADGSSFKFGKVSYRLYGHYSARFNIDSTTGQITTAELIDREDKFGDVYRLLAVAEDNAATQRRRTIVSVTILILDQNDNSPTFSFPSYSASISEESLHPDFLTVAATDPDKGTSGKVTYSIVTGNDDSLFSINAETGSLSATTKPDREGLGDRYTLTIKASDGGSPAKTDTATVAISIRDINDNNPVFDLLTYRSTVNENDAIGNEVVRVRATEKDVGLSATITYSITAGSPSTRKFSVDTGTGSITTRGTIDYESDPHFYTLTVTATDGMGRQGNCSVVVEITDYNDNAPTFTRSVYTTSIPENLPTLSFVLSVSAIDKDASSINSAVGYSILAGADDVFTIDSATGNISVLTPPDYEVKKFYSLDVQAQDQASPASARQTGVSRVEITITDVNDNTPTFGGSYFFNVAESATVGVLVGVVSASDLDDPSVDENGVVKYTLTGSNADDFSIGSSTGHIAVAQSLDYEARSSYELTAIATDGGGLTSSSSVKISVIDVNDNSPKFTQINYSVDIDENLPRGHTVVQVSAYEKDTVKQISYSLRGGQGHFNIVPNTGLVLTAIPLDYETTERYTLFVTATDNGIPSRESSVVVYVNVKDLNDNDPLFSKPEYTATVEEKLPGGQSIATISATDKDSLANGDVSYSIVDGVGKSHFAIDSLSGYVTTTTSLDRETQDTYTLTIQARDNGSPARTTTAILTVTVDDINDNTPYFPPPSYSTATLTEDTPIGTIFHRVKATDDDLGGNQKITYSLSGDDGAFQINETTGELRTARSLDRETNAKYELVVTASDGSNSATTTIYVNVIAGNCDQFASSAKTFVCTVSKLALFTTLSVVLVF